MNLPDLPIPVSLPTFWPVLVALTLAGALGLRRGWVRELALLGGVLFTWLTVVALGFSVLGFVNRIALIVRFSLEGGFDAPDPMPLLRALRLDPPIDPWHPQMFYAGMFAVGVVLSYIASSRVGPKSATFGDAFLGGLAGALNGYVVAYVALEQIRPSVAAGGPLDSFAVLAQHVPTVVIGAVVGVVLIALVASLAGGVFSGRSGRAAAPRASGRPGA